MKILVTGAGGLIGSEAVEYFAKQGHVIVGIDNNMRSVFFGPKGSVHVRLNQLKKLENVTILNIDIRDGYKIYDLCLVHKFDVIIHCAAQPSHDWAVKDPQIDFKVNANGTLNVLEAARQTSKPIFNASPVAKIKCFLLDSSMALFITLFSEVN